jgi:hypothetical protein
LEFFSGQYNIIEYSDSQLRPYSHLFIFFVTYKWAK